MKILKSTVIQAATIQMEDWEERYSENGMPSCGKLKTKRNDIRKIITRCRGILRVPMPFSRAEKNLEKRSRSRQATGRYRMLAIRMCLF